MNHITIFPRSFGVLEKGPSLTLDFTCFIIFYIVYKQNRPTVYGHLLISENYRSKTKKVSNLLKIIVKIKPADQAQNLLA